MEQLDIQGSVENNPKQNSALIEREPIEGTPFTLIKQNEKYFTVMGDYRITETTKTVSEQMEALEKNKWLNILTMIGIAIEKHEQMKGGFDPNK